MTDIRTAVRQVYAGAEGRLWELIMGEQIHIDGFASSMGCQRSSPKESLASKSTKQQPW